MHPAIVPLAPADVPAVARAMVRMAFETEALPLDEPLVTAAVGFLLAHPDLGTYYLGKTPAGDLLSTMLITIEYNPLLGAVRWWIQSVFVEEGHRQRGLFKKTLSEVQSRARGAGVRELSLYVQHDNQLAKGIYLRSGFKDENCMMVGTDLVYGKFQLKTGLLELQGLDQGQASALFKGGAEQLAIQTQRFSCFRVILGSQALGWLSVFFEFSDWRNGLFVYVRHLQWTGTAEQLRGLLPQLVSALSRVGLQARVIGVRFLTKDMGLAEMLREAGLQQSNYLIYSKTLE